MEHSFAELSAHEMKEVSGGGWRGIIALGLALHVFLEAYNDPEAHFQAFREGMEAAK